MDARTHHGREGAAREPPSSGNPRTRGRELAASCSQPPLRGETTIPLRENCVHDAGGSAMAMHRDKWWASSVLVRACVLGALCCREGREGRCARRDRREHLPAREARPARGRMRARRPSNEEGPVSRSAWRRAASPQRGGRPPSAGQPVPARVRGAGREATAEPSYLYASRAHGHIRSSGSEPAAPTCVLQPGGGSGQARAAWTLRSEACAEPGLAAFAPIQGPPPPAPPPMITWRTGASQFSLRSRGKEETRARPAPARASPRSPARAWLPPPRRGPAARPSRREKGSARF